MPYINREDRDTIACAVNELDSRIFTAGDLNFAITKLCLAYLKWIEDARSTTGYAALNEVMGVFESSKLEFWRRVVVPYEDEKCAENGDVYVNDDD